MDIPALVKLQDLQAKCNRGEVLDNNEVKALVEDCLRRMVAADQIYEMCSALHREEKNRTIMVEEYHSVLVFCRQMAYKVIKRFT